MNRYNIFENVLFLNETEIDPVQYLTSVNEYCDAIQTNEIITEGFKDFVSTIIAKIKEMIKKFTEAVKKFFKGIKDKFKKEKTKETIDFVKTHNKEIENELVKEYVKKTETDSGSDNIPAKEINSSDKDRILPKILVFDGYKYCDRDSLNRITTDMFLNTITMRKIIMDKMKILSSTDINISDENADDFISALGDRNINSKIAILEEKAVFKFNSVADIVAMAQENYRNVFNVEDNMNNYIRDLNTISNLIEINMRKKQITDDYNSDEVEHFFRKTLVAINKTINTCIHNCNQVIVYNRKCFDFYNNICKKLSLKIF